ncbi:MAG: Uma2 family endonuclease [Cyanobacteriota bacterium]|nr:Uma2 family endonuclease [Cyanobacteriota bacterium]
MLITDRHPYLPNADERPDSDDTPVDDEDQNLLPNLLLATLYQIWQDRQDWFFAVDMGLYHTSGADPKVPVVPDAFLSLRVERRKEGKSRRSYATWEEGGVVPSLVLEMVSHTARGEYGHKLELYQKMGVLYYAVYNPEFYPRDQHDPFEVYKLENGAYVRQAGEPLWMPEIGLGIGRLTEIFGGIEREWLAWFNEAGETYGLLEVSRQELGGEQLRADLTQQVLEQRRRAEAAEEQARQLAAYLRSLGVDPDNLPPGEQNQRRF